MAVGDEYRQRAREVRLYLRSLQSLESRLLPGRSFYRARAAITASRAAAFIMMYNCVEFGLADALAGLRAEILVRAANFGAIKLYWQEEIVRAHFHHPLTQGTNHIEFLKRVTRFMPGKLDWNLQDASLPFAGNIDHTKIFELMSKIEYRWIPPRSTLGGTDLKLVRDTRNDLAHGNETFEAIGALYSTKDLVDKFDRIRIFMRSLLTRIDRYKTKQLYLRS